MEGQQGFDGTDILGETRKNEVLNDSDTVIVISVWI